MYLYDNLRSSLFTDEGQLMLLVIRDRVHRLLKLAGAVRMQEALTGQSGDTWQMLACVDRLVELGELSELKYGDCAGQHRVFVAKDSREVTT